MFQELQKELIASATEGFKKLIRLGVKLGMFVIGCWMFIGAGHIGIIVPTHIVTMMGASKEAKTGQINVPSRAEIEMATQNQASEPTVQYENTRPIQQRVTARNVRQPDLRSELRDTRNVIGEARRMGSTLQNFVKA